jgi:folate-binding protein YgfZ
MNLRATPQLVPHTDVAGHSVVLHFVDPVAEYNALRHGAALVDRSHRHRLTLKGDAAADMLNGLVTNDVSQLEPGRGQYAAVLSAKGRIIADLRIFRRADGSFLVDAPARAAQGWMEVVRKFINPRLAMYSDQSLSLSDRGVFGPRAAENVAAVLSLDAQLLRTREPLELLETDWNGERVLIASSDELGLPGFDLFISSQSAPALDEAFISAGVTPAGLSAWEIARIENGTPEWGLDMDETTLSQEANLDKLQAISFTKGCYTGQEVVARVHFRGHVNQHLRMLRFVASVLPPKGAKIFSTGEGDEAPERSIGEVRSAAHSPRLGGVAIAMVRREAPIGSSVTIRWEGTECQAGVYELPLEPTAA